MEQGQRGDGKRREKVRSTRKEKGRGVREENRGRGGGRDGGRDEG